MNRIKYLKEQRGAKLKELEALRNSAQSRSYTDDEAKRFDALETEIKNINADLEREERANNFAIAAAAGNGVQQRSDEHIGMNEKEIERYSLMRAIRLKAEGRQLDGIEGEMAQEEAKRLGRSAEGFFIPFDVFLRSGARRAEKRALEVGVASNGGYTVDSMNDFSNMVELLRNQSHVLASGARVLTGLMGDVTIPRVITGATAYWVSESGTITSSNPTFGQLAMKPRRLGASVPYTKQFLAQSGIGVENFVRDDVLAAFGLELDRVALNGAGAVEPLGILNLASGDRATSVTFGAAPTWAKVVSFETNVETANALSLPGAPYTYMTTPGVKGAWKTTSKVANTAAFLWEGGDLVNGYAAKSTNQVPSNKVIFGQFGQVVYGEWAGLDVVVDPYTLATTGQVKVTMQKLVDMVVRQGKAFAVSTDAGNQ